MAKWPIQRQQLWYVLLVCVWDKVCMRSFFALVLLMGCRGGKEKEPFWPKPLLFITNCVLFCGKIRCSRKYRVLTDTSSLVSYILQYISL